MRGGLINWRQEYDPEEIYEMEQNMQRQQEAYDSQMRRLLPQTREEVINEIINYVRLLRRQRKFDELISIFANYGVNYQEIDQFLNQDANQGANFMSYDELVDIADALDRINNPEDDRIPNFLETDMMDADLDEEEEEETKDDVIEERVTGRRRQRDEPPDRETSRQRLDFGSGLRQAMGNNVFGHKSIQLGVRPLSL